MRKRNASPRRRTDSLAPSLTLSDQNPRQFGESLAQLARDGLMEQAAKALRAELSLGRSDLARAGFDALGDSLWAWPGFARESLRALERCQSPGGGDCLSAWSRAASNAGALPMALGRGGHARGQALAALGEAPFWAAQSSERAARELGALLSLCVEGASDSEAGGCVRAALGSWLSPEGKSAKSMAALRLASETAAFELALRPLWLCAAGDGRESAAFSLLERVGFSRCAPTLLMALGEAGLVSLRSRVDGRSLAHYASAALDEPAWRLALRRPDLLREPNALGGLPSEALGSWLNRLCESDSPRSARQLSGAERMLLLAMGAERDRPGCGFGPEFIDGLRPAARARCEWSALACESPEPIGAPRSARAL